MKKTTTPAQLTRALRRFTSLVLALGALVLAPLVAAQQTPADKLADFDYDNGADPRGGLVQGSDGDFYGMAWDGGAENDGTVFKVTAAGVLTKLADLDPGLGRDPYGSFVLGTDGNLYGLTSRGATGRGSVIKVTPAGVVSRLASLNGTTGGGARGSLVQDIDGDFYGLTSGGGETYGVGTVFKVTTAGVISLVAEFDESNGAYPTGSLVLGSDGDFYGMAGAGGAHGAGTVFKVTAAGVLTKLADFEETATGINPQGSLVEGGNGDFYGLVPYGGENGHGTAFKVTAAGVLTKLVDFEETATGANPNGSLVLGGDGNFYGTTSNGGSPNGATGTVFRLTPAGTLSVEAVTIDGNDVGTIPGRKPQGDLLATADGNFLGMTSEGGDNQYGMIFRLHTGLVPFTGFHLGGNGRAIAPGAATTQAANGTTLTSIPGVPFAQTFTIYNRTATAVTVSSIAVSGTGAASFTRGAVTLPAVLAAGETLAFTVTFQSALAAAEAAVTVTSNEVTTPSYAFALSGEIQVLQKRADFNEPVTGGYPEGGLVRGSNGNFYGLNSSGGAHGSGTVFQVTAAGVVTTLADFEYSSTGASPQGNLVQGTDGDFYGLTYFGGANDHGTAFKVTAAGVLTVLAHFDQTTTGSYPQGSLVQGSGGDFYGLTNNGGANDHGVVFKLTAAGVLTKLADFDGLSTGRNPTGSLVQGSDGDFYGLTPNGGADNAGTVYKVTAAGVLTKLTDFVYETTAGYPYGSLVEGTEGAFYGLASEGGANEDGTAFKVTTVGVLTVLAHFDEPTTGLRPYGSLVLGSDGDFYGLTSAGGANDVGTAFKLTPAGVLTKLGDFDAAITGASPRESLVQGNDGNLYSLTNTGGATDAGTFFVLYAGLGGGTPPDTTPPATTITSTQPTPTSSNAAAITFSGTDDVEVASFEGSLDGAPFATVTSPVTLSGLVDGAHTFQVRARDAANNVDASPAMVAWLVDTIAPSFTLPADITAAATSAAGAVVTYTASANDAGSGVAMSSFTPESGSTFGAGMTTTVNASATDAAGNTATGSFTVMVGSWVAGTLAFGSETPSANPLDELGQLNLVAVPIQRTGGSDGTVTVLVVPSTLATVPSGFAKYVYGTHYEFVSGSAAGTIVTFGPGQMSATVNVQLKAAASKKGKFKLTLGATTGGAGTAAPLSATVTINAKDATKPTVVISTPAATVAAPGIFNLTGTVKDNGTEDLSSFTVALNGEPVTPTRGAYVANTAVAYNVDGLQAQNGSNTLVVMARDAMGNTTIVTKNFTCAGGALSAALAGTYSGLLVATGTPDNNTSGFFTATVTSAAAFTGKVTLGGITVPFKGLLSNEGVAKFTATATDLDLTDDDEFDSYLGSLGFTIPTAGGDITATLSTQAEAGSTIATATAAKNAFDATHLVATAHSDLLTMLTGTPKGVYNVSLPNETQAVLTDSQFPQGDGVGTLTLSNAGVVTLVGNLADGTAYSATGNLKADLTAPLHVNLYRRQGALAGTLQFDPGATDSDVSGANFLWLRPTLSAARVYKAGWPNGVTLDPVGTKFVAPATGGVLPSLNAVHPTLGNATMDFRDGLLSLAVSKSLNIALTPANTVTKLGGDTTYTLTVTNSTGGFSGTFTHSPGKSVGYKGIILEKGGNNGGFGYFLSPAPLSTVGGAQGGSVTLQANP